MKHLRIIKVCSDIGGRKRGASLGPDALLYAASAMNHHWVESAHIVNIETCNGQLFQPDRHTWAHRIAGVTTVCRNLVDELANTTPSFTLILSGDHSTAAGSISGMADGIGVVWIDAHADMNSPYTTPSGNMHGMPLAAALGEDNAGCASHQPDEESIACWNLLKHLGRPATTLKPRDLVFVGVRDTDPEEQLLIQKLKIKNFTVEEVRKNGAIAAARETLKQLSHCQHLYISFDVDALDASLVHGTGTPATNGMMPEEVTKFIKEIARTKQVKYLEITEINPLVDTQNSTAALISGILEEVLPVLLQK